MLFLKNELQKKKKLHKPRTGGDPPTRAQAVPEKKAWGFWLISDQSESAV